MTPVGRDWPKGYERGLDNAAISAILRIQKAGRAVHLGNVSFGKSGMHKLGTLVALISVVALASGPAAAAVEYQVTVNTSSLSGELGTVEFGFSSPEFTGPDSYNETGTATISDFSTDGSLVGAGSSGHESGGLPGTVIISDVGDGATNLYSLGEDFGNINTFDLTFAGPDVSGPFCPTTATNCSLPAFTLDVNGVEQAFVTTTPGGVLAAGASPLVTLSLIAVPEAPTWAMMIIGMGALGGVLRRRPGPAIS